MPNEFIIKNGGTVVVWGACHHSFFILSQLKNFKKINYVVDSAVFKQNKFTPSTGLMIYDPRFLISNPPDTILIMASSYSNEVAKIILNEYKSIKKIYLLDNSKLKAIK